MYVCMYVFIYLFLYLFIYLLVCCLIISIIIIPKILIPIQSQLLPRGPIACRHMTDFHTIPALAAGMWPDGYESKTLAASAPSVP